jgi:hypothetical protein
MFPFVSYLSFIFLYLTRWLSFQSINYFLLSLSPKSVQLVKKQLKLTYRQISISTVHKFFAEGINFLRNPKIWLRYELFVAIAEMDQFFGV